MSEPLDVRKKLQSMVQEAQAKQWQWRDKVPPTLEDERINGQWNQRLEHLANQLAVTGLKVGLNPKGR